VRRGGGIAARDALVLIAVRRGLVTVGGGLVAPRLGDIALDCGLIEVRCGLVGVRQRLGLFAAGVLAGKASGRLAVAGSSSLADGGRLS